GKSASTSASAAWRASADATPVDASASVVNSTASSHLTSAAARTFSIRAPVYEATAYPGPMRTQDQDGSLIVYVGCYTTPDRNGHGEGIAAYRMDPSSGDWQPLGVLARVANPSFLALHPGERFLYCVHGGELSEVSAFSLSNGGTKLTQLGCVSSGGVNPVHLDVHPS